jgi:DNA-binding XRE family transcriptional regulator
MKLEIDVNKQLGDLMKAMRLAAGLRQDDIAKAIGTKRPQVCNIESGRMCNVLLSHLVAAGDRCGFEVKLIVQKRKARNAELKQRSGNATTKTP